jgi:hypothetical protein
MQRATKQLWAWSVLGLCALAFLSVRSGGAAWWEQLKELVMPPVTAENEIEEWEREHLGSRAGFYAQRAYPRATLPPGAQLNAFNQLRLAEARAATSWVACAATINAGLATAWPCADWAGADLWKSAYCRVGPRFHSGV